MKKYLSDLNNLLFLVLGTEVIHFYVSYIENY